MVSAIFTIIFGALFTFCNSIQYMMLCLFVILFFGSGIMPIATGVMIHACPKDLKTFGSGNAQILYNLVGYIPAPFIYGLLK